MNATDDSRLLTMEQFARHLGVSLRLVQYWLTDPDEAFPAIFLTGKTVRVRLSEGNAWVDRRSERLAREAPSCLLRLRAQRGLDARQQLKEVHREDPSADSRGDGNGKRGVGGHRKAAPRYAGGPAKKVPTKGAKEGAR